jgi:prefoldin subunit 5
MKTVERGMGVDMAERVAALEVAQGRLEERVESLEAWQAKQNGSLQRLEEKMDKIQQWLIGLLGGVIASLVLLLVNMSLGR